MTRCRVRAAAVTLGALLSMPLVSIGPALAALLAVQQRSVFHVVLASFSVLAAVFAGLTIARAWHAKRALAPPLLSIACLAALCVLLALTVLRPLAPPSMPPRGGDLVAGRAGERLALRHEEGVGRSQLPPLILIHGGPGGPNGWTRDTMERLARDGHDVWTYDQLGTGGSARLEDPEGYSVARHVADLDTVRRRTGADEVILVGHSWGATLASHYVISHRARVAGLVLVAPGPIRPIADADFRDTDVLASARHAETGPRYTLWRLLMDVDPSAARAFLPDAEGDAHRRRVLATRTRECGDAPSIRSASGAGFYSHVMTLRSLRAAPDIRGDLESLDVPSVVVRGSCDGLASKPASEAARLLGAPLITVRNGGHDVVGLTREAAIEAIARLAA